MQTNLPILSAEADHGDLLKSPAYAQAVHASNWEEFNKGVRLGTREKLGPPICEMFIRTSEGVRLNNSEHYHFLKEIEQMSKQLDLGYVPDILLINDFPAASVAMRKMPNAGGIPASGTIIMNKSFVDLFHINPTAPISVEVKGVMAHELSHLRYDMLSSLSAQLGTRVAPLVGMAGLWLFDKATHRKEKLAAQSIPDYVSTLHQEFYEHAAAESKRIDEEPHKQNEWQIDPKWKKAAIESGRYLAAAAVSYGAMLLVSRHISLSNEFFADKTAVELSKQPEAFKQALVKIHDAYKQMGKTMPKPTTLKEALNEMRDILHSMTTHAHPSLPERLAHIDKVAANMLTKSTTVPIPL